MVGGVAYHAGKKVQEGRDADYEQEQRIADLEAQQGAAAQPAAPAAACPRLRAVSASVSP